MKYPEHTSGGLVMEQRLRLVQGTGNRSEKRSAERRPVQVPGQIVWKDHRGQTRMATVVTRDVSEHGVSFECRTGLIVPMYRLVYFQVDRHVRNRPDLPATLRKQNVLSAVFRVGECSEKTGTPTEYGLRLLVEPQPSAVAATAPAPSWTGSGNCTRTA
jgi:hypothetical protein